MTAALRFTRARVPDADWLWANVPCRAACPVHTDAGAYVTAIAEGRFAEAYAIARAPNPFPSICGRVCAAPCEQACRRGSIDAPVSIRALKRFASWASGADASSEAWHAGHGPVPPVTLPSVGIVGAGPAGLAAAHDLRLLGHAVTVYEASEVPGGMMVLGIPEFRLPRTLVAREIDAIASLGVELVLGHRIGETHPLAELVERHAAVFLAIGTGQGRDLGIPGHELDGVLRAIEFLLNANRGFTVELGERVVVLGGGNVAMDAARMALRTALGDPTPAPAGETLTASLDAARTARRAGVRDVTIVTLETRAEMPAAEDEIEAAEAEGIRFVYGRGAVRVEGEGRVRGLVTRAVRSLRDAAGRFAPVLEDAGDETLAADTVVLAVGQTADLSLLGTLEVARAPWGGLAVEAATLRTSHPKLWAGGDVAFGPRNLIDAVADGRRAAASMHAVLTGAPSAPVVTRVQLSPAPVHRGLVTDYDARPRVPIPVLPAARRIGPQEVETGYDAAQAVAEAERCLRCAEQVMLRPERCILCGLCVDVCPHKCISIVPAGEGRSALVLDETHCVRCALCVERCPPAALTLVHAEVTCHA